MSDFVKNLVEKILEGDIAVVEGKKANVATPSGNFSGIIASLNSNSLLLEDRGGLTVIFVAQIVAINIPMDQ